MNSIDQLFAEWRAERPEYLHFSNDGILIDSEWAVAKPRIAFILKESNDDFVEIRGRHHGPHGNSPVFWRNMRMWRFAVTNAFNNRLCTFDEAFSDKETPLSDIAYVNLKKNAECRPTSMDFDIHSYVSLDWDFLQRQISLINPEVLFLCGTFKYVKDYLNLHHIGGRIYACDEKIVVDFYHPSCRKGYQVPFDELTHDLRLGIGKG